MPESDETYVAQWTPIEYTISYDMNGHGESNPINLLKYTIETGEYMPYWPADVEGWTFSGWEPETIPVGTTGPFTFTAIWTQNDEPEIEDNEYDTPEFRQTLDEIDQQYPIEIEPMSEEEYQEMVEDMQTEPFPNSHYDTMRLVEEEDDNMVLPENGFGETVPSNQMYMFGRGFLEQEED